MYKRTPKPGDIIRDRVSILDRNVKIHGSDTRRRYIEGKPPMKNIFKEEIKNGN